MRQEELHREILGKTWFHRFEIVPGLWSPGSLTVDAASALDLNGLPRDLQGKRVIDVGALDGAYSFEFERRGASVVAVDIQDPEKTGFGIAKQIINSNVRYMILSVYDLTPDMIGYFDIAWYWGVYYHLKDPLVGFRRIYDVLTGGGKLYFEGAVLDYAWNVEPSLNPDQTLLEMTSRSYSPHCWDSLAGVA